MKIYNQDKTQELQNFDLEKGYLQNDKLFIRHIEPVEEQGHYKIIKEYENGGKDVEWVIDIKGVEEHDEFEDIQVYIPYTEEELLQDELYELLTWFNEYDNQVKQYERSVRLGIEFDKDIAELDAQADINAARITEIRNLLKNSQN